MHHLSEKMILLYISVLLIILSKQTIQIPLKTHVNDTNDFNGTLTEEYLNKLGYTNYSEMISLVKSNVSSIAPNINFKHKIGLLKI